MPEILITEFMERAAVDDLGACFDVAYDPDAADRLNAGAGRAAQADCRALVVRNRTRVDAALLDAMPTLACVGRLGVGLDNIDLEACRARGVAVYPATGANDLSVAEYVIAVTLVLLRGAYFSGAAVAAGDWPRRRLIGREASGRTMGLVGIGAIAQEVARRAAALGMRVAAVDPFASSASPGWSLARRVELPDLLSEADVVSLHVPLTESTRGLIGAAEIARMKPDAILVNTARGGVVDEAALADALKASRLRGAAIDVFADEPLPGGTALASAPNLILTPHIAGVTEESNVRVSRLIAERVAAHLRGERIP